MHFSEHQLERYSRQFVLHEIGVSGQKKLLSSKVLVIGAGALGSSALLYLAAAGVGTLGIADHDRVARSNLQRQIIHRTEQIGTEKTVSAKQTLHAINPDVSVVLHSMLLTAGNVETVIRPYDFIIDATDRFETKFLINDACVLAGKPYTHAGAVRFGGQIMTYVPKQGPCLRCLLGEIPPQDQNTMCAQAGVLGAVTGVIGSIQATEAIKYLLSIGQLLTGRVLQFDALKMDMRITERVKADPYCRVCGEAPDILSLSENREQYAVNACAFPEGANAGGAT